MHACFELWVSGKGIVLGFWHFLVQKQAMLFRCDIKEEQQLFMSVATHERIKISPCTMLSSENIVIQINNLCQEISSAQLGLFNKNLVKSPNFVRVSRQQTIPGCFKAGSCRCETFQELLTQSVLCCANHKSCS